MTDKDAEMCWVCLGPSEPSRPLVRACRCPRSVHRLCLARWQLHSAGKSEETACRFCFANLPDWRSAYNLPTATPVMSVWHNNVHHLLEVKPGVAGQAEFQHNIRKIFALGPHDIIELTFGCKEPGSDQDMALRGWQSYDAAVHCAAISAGASASKHSTNQEQHSQPQDHPTSHRQGLPAPHQHLQSQGQHTKAVSNAAMCQPCDHSSSSSASTGWPWCPPVQRSLSTQSTGNSVQHEAISRESLNLDCPSTSHRARSKASLVPAVLRSLHAGSKRSRRDMARQH